MRKNELLEAINNSKARSAWNKGVKIYAYELVEALEVEEIPQDKTELKSLLLNGAADWKQYSWGGYSLIYDCDIAERLCCPSELKKGLRRREQTKQIRGMVRHTGKSIKPFF